MIIISAMSKDRVIGSGEGMPWSVPAEYEQFLEFIRGQTVIIGRRSHEIFGPDLTSAHNIVVSRSVNARSSVESDHAIVCSSVEEAIETGEAIGKSVFSAGGASIYAQTVPLADTMYLSYIRGDFEGDAYFPAFDQSEWNVGERTDHGEFEFVVYRRKE